MGLIASTYSTRIFRAPSWPFATAELAGCSFPRIITASLATRSLTTAALDWLRSRGANIVEEHPVSESFGGDGLIVATFDTNLPVAPPAITRNLPSRSLFREVEFDLADALNQIRELKGELERLRSA